MPGKSAGKRRGAKRARREVSEVGGSAATIEIDPPALKLLLAVIPVVGVLLICLIRNNVNVLYTLLFVEDSIFEYLSSLFYGVSAVLAIRMARSFRAAEQSLEAVAYALLGVGLLFVFAEEISWGQRIFGIETPQLFMESNTQQEISLHNLETVQGTVHWLYIGIGAFGGFAWLLAAAKPRSLAALTGPYFVPRWYLVPYFLPVFVFYMMVEFPSLRAFEYRHPDQEPGEFILSMGFLLFLGSNRLRQRMELSLPAGRRFRMRW